MAAARQLLSPSETLRQQHRAGSGRTRSREADTLAKLSAFSSSLKATKEEVGEPSVEPVTYSGQVLDADGVDDEAWFAGKLKFRKHTDDLFRTGTVDDYATYDPHGKFGARRSAAAVVRGRRASTPRGGDRRRGGDGRGAVGTGDGSLSRWRQDFSHRPNGNPALSTQRAKCSPQLPR